MIKKENLSSLPSKRVSFVIPLYNEEAVIADFVAALYDKIKMLQLCAEVILVDDGSNDNTPQIISTLKNNYDFSYLRLSRNFGKEQALSAGIDNATGDAIILMDADFQHPFDVIPEFLKYWSQGYDMVYATRTSREDEGLRKRLGTKLFYRLVSNTKHYHIPPNAGDFRLLDRKIIDTLKTLPERNRFMKGLYSWVGYKQIAIPFEVQPRAKGESRWNYTALFDLAITGITSFTSLPLRMIAIGGVTISIFAIAYAFWIVLNTWLFGIQTPGWATLVTTISFFSGIQLFALGIVGEYIGRIFDEVKQRPNYIIDESSSHRIPHEN